MNQTHQGQFWEKYFFIIQQCLYNIIYVIFNADFNALFNFFLWQTVQDLCSKIYPYLGFGLPLQAIIAYLLVIFMQNLIKKDF